MAQAALWREIDKEQMTTLFRKMELGEGRAILAGILKLQADRTHLKDAIQLDLAYYTVAFCRESSFSPDKTSAVFGITRSVHTEAMKNFWPLERTCKFFKEQLMLYSIQRPPYSIGLFTLQDVNRITEYVTDTYFRHYNMYKYAFTKRTVMDLSSLDSWTELPLTWSALSSGLSVEEQQQKAEAEREEQRLKEEEEHAAAQAEAEAELEAARAALPEDVQKKIEDVVNAQLGEVTGQLKNQIGTHQTDRKSVV